MNRYQTIILAGCLAFLVGLAGCAKPRTGPFDVPSAAPGTLSASGQSAGSGASSGFGGSSDAVNRAAAEIVAAKVFFTFDRADIRPEAHPVINRVAELLRQNPPIRISLHGHCDERGSYEYNYGLGERRARAVHAALLRAGAPAAQIDMVTYGKKVLATPGRTEDAHSRNRRVEFIVLTTCY